MNELELEERLDNLYMACRRQLVSIGYSEEQFQYCLVPIRLNNRLKTTYGRHCIVNYDNGMVDKWIEINEKYFIVADDTEVMDTIMHELVHHIVSVVNPKSRCKHGRLFKEVASYINEQLGYEIQEFATFDYSDDIDNLVNKKEYDA